MALQWCEILNEIERVIKGKTVRVKEQLLIDAFVEQTDDNSV